VDSVEVESARAARERAMAEAADFATGCEVAMMDMDMDGIEGFSRGWVAACRAMKAYLEGTK
jgi:hypothetical protein